MTLEDTVAAAQPLAPDRQTASIEHVLDLLRNGRMTVEMELGNASNYAFLVSVKQPDLACLAVYKPRRGERPLWDFPRGTLFKREYAAFLVSMALDWTLVPPTVLRRGRFGIGAVQLYIDAVSEGNFFSLRERCGAIFQRMCAFDYVINNADRKGGHCLLGSDGRVWAIDHGISFNEEFKLRTVIWDWAGEPLPQDIVDDLQDFSLQLKKGSDLAAALRRLLLPNEVDAMRRRVGTLLDARTFPMPLPDFPNIPWPLL